MPLLRFHWDFFGPDEMTIKLSHVQENVLDYVIHQEGRYNIQLLRPQENIVELVSKNPSRKSISVKGLMPKKSF